MIFTADDVSDIPFLKDAWTIMDTSRCHNNEGDDDNQEVNGDNGNHDPFGEKWFFPLKQPESAVRWRNTFLTQINVDGHKLQSIDEMGRPWTDYDFVPSKVPKIYYI